MYSQFVSVDVREPGIVGSLSFDVLVQSLRSAENGVLWKQIIGVRGCVRGIETKDPRLLITGFGLRSGISLLDPSELYKEGAGKVY